MNDIYNAMVAWASSKYDVVYGDVCENNTNSKTQYIIIINRRIRLILYDQFLKISMPVCYPIVTHKLYYASLTFFDDLEKLIIEMC